MNRRRWLKSVIAAGALGLPFTSSAMATSATQAAAEINLLKGERTLNLFRPETNEALHLTYMINGKWVPGAYEKICWHLRDWQAKKSTDMDVQLIAALDWIQTFLKRHGFSGPLHILSGYRTTATNTKVNGSPKSEHLFGRAVDFRVPGLDVAYLGTLVRWLLPGGVGVYDRKNFIHMDTGARREWVG